MLNIALPKGRLADKVCTYLTETGYNVAPVDKDDRRLVFRDDDNGICYFFHLPLPPQGRRVLVVSEARRLRPESA